MLEFQKLWATTIGLLAKNFTTILPVIKIGNMLGREGMCPYHFGAMTGAQPISVSTQLFVKVTMSGKILCCVQHRCRTIISPYAEGRKMSTIIFQVLIVTRKGPYLTQVIKPMRFVQM